MKNLMPRRSILKPYSCDRCTNAYASAFSLRRHKTQCHPTLAEEVPSRPASNTVLSRQEINSRHYENNKRRLRHKRLRSKYMQMAHIQLLKERICKIAEGAYDNYWPEKPVEPSGEDLNDLYVDSKLLWKRYQCQLKTYRSELADFKFQLQDIPWENINERVTLMMNEINFEEYETGLTTDASVIDSDIAVSDNESND